MLDEWGIRGREGRERTKPYDPLPADRWWFDPEIESFVLHRGPSAQIRAKQFFAILNRVKRGTMNATPGIMKSVTRPDWKRELIEAICLAKVRPKEEK